jgi:hypothetical protein
VIALLPIGVDVLVTWSNQSQGKYLGRQPSPICNNWPGMR